MAVRSIPGHYYNSNKGPGLALKEALETASAEIHLAAQEDPELRGMGTTCVAMAILTPELYAAYVGDTRLYLLRDDGFYQLTEDHTVVGEMVRKGIITREQARNHEERNVLSLSMGGRPEITASYWEKPMVLRAGDRLLLCSDGLHDLVGDFEMQAIIAVTPTHLAVQNLIDAAKRNGGHDNITVAILRVRESVSTSAGGVAPTVVQTAVSQPVAAMASGAPEGSKPLFSHPADAVQPMIVQSPMPRPAMLQAKSRNRGFGPAAVAGLVLALVAATLLALVLIEHIRERGGAHNPTASSNEAVASTAVASGAPVPLAPVSVGMPPPIAPSEAIPPLEPVPSGHGRHERP